MPPDAQHQRRALRIIEEKRPRRYFEANSRACGKREHGSCRQRQISRFPAAFAGKGDGEADNFKRRGVEKAFWQKLEKRRFFPSGDGLLKKSGGSRQTTWLQMDNR